MCPIKLPTKRIFWIFHILKINRIMQFCNLFIRWPSYMVNNNSILTVIMKVNRGGSDCVQ